MTSTTVSIRVDEDTKRAASEVADYYGLDLSSVTRAFWRQMVREDAVPLTLRGERPNAESREAIRETEEILERVRRGELPALSADEFIAELRS